MRVLEAFPGPAQQPRSPIIAIGFFDGLHRGHQAILQRVVHQAQSQGGTPMVLTFDPHPQKVISSGDAPLLLQTPAQKQEILESIGIELLLILPFTRKLSLYSPAEFVDRVLIPLKPREVHVGENFRFGHRRGGDFQSLIDLGQERGFSVEAVPQVEFRRQRISSTRIRSLLINGQLALARRLLGRPYELRGDVVRGARQGTGLGFPTANLRPRNELIPATGVYASHVEVAGQRYIGATNIGYRPTLYSDGKDPVVETFLLDFDGDLYGQPIRLGLYLRLREERRFEGPQQLRSQVAADVERVRCYYRRCRSRRTEDERG